MTLLRKLTKKYGVCCDLLVLGALALGLRLWGIGFDLPILYHRDEARYVSIPLNILKSGDYNPHFFNYPSLFFYLLALVYILYFLALASRGAVGNLDGLRLPEQVLPNVVGRATMPSQLLVGRAFVALCGALTVLLVYWIARKAYGRRAGWLAAMLLALSPTHIRNSHFVAPDVTMALLVTASLAFSYLVLTRGRRRDYLLAGALAGLAIATKYNAYAVLIPLLLAHYMRYEGRVVVNADLVLGLLFSGVAFLIATPYAFLDLPAFLNGIAFEVRHYATLGDPGSEGQNAWLWYASYLLRWEGVLPLLAVGGAIHGALTPATQAGATRRRQTWLFVSFPVVSLLLVSSYAVKNDRTVLTLLPVLSILGGAFLDQACALLLARPDQTRRAGAVTTLLAIALVVGVLAWPTSQALRIDLRFRQEDVRTVVTRWVQAQLPAESRIVGEYYSPLVADGAQPFRWVDRAIDQPLDWYRTNADYIVFVQNRYGGFFLDPARYPDETAAYQAMFSQFALVKEFQGGALGNPCRALLYKVQP